MRQTSQNVIALGNSRQVKRLGQHGTGAFHSAAVGVETRWLKLQFRSRRDERRAVEFKIALTERSADNNIVRTPAYTGSAKISIASKIPFEQINASQVTAPTRVDNVGS